MDMVVSKCPDRSSVTANRTAQIVLEAQWFVTNRKELALGGDNELFAELVQHCKVGQRPCTHSRRSVILRNALEAPALPSKRVW